MRKNTDERCQLSSAISRLAQWIAGGASAASSPKGTHGWLQTAWTMQGLSQPSQWLQSLGLGPTDRVASPVETDIGTPSTTIVRLALSPTTSRTTNVSFEIRIHMLIHHYLISDLTRWNQGSSDQNFGKCL